MEALRQVREIMPHAGAFPIFLQVAHPAADEHQGIAVPDIGIGNAYAVAGQGVADTALVGQRELGQRSRRADILLGDHEGAHRLRYRFLRR